MSFSKEGNVKLLSISIDNKLKFPTKDGIIGESSSSSSNYNYINSLQDCINVPCSAVNNFNFALDVSSSLYVSKKINSYANTSIFEFTPNSEIPLNINFSYDNEIIGKSIYGLSLNKLRENYTTEHINLIMTSMKLLIESPLIIDNNEFCEYEMIVYGDIIKENIIKLAPMEQPIIPFQPFRFNQ